MQGLRGPWHPGLDHTGSLGVATGNPRWIFGAHAAHLRVQLLRCSLTHSRCARSALGASFGVPAPCGGCPWIAESLVAGFRSALQARASDRLLHRSVRIGLATISVLFGTLGAKRTPRGRRTGLVGAKRAKRRSYLRSTWWNFSMRAVADQRRRSAGG